MSSLSAVFPSIVEYPAESEVKYAFVYPLNEFETNERVHIMKNGTVYVWCVNDSPVCEDALYQGLYAYGYRTIDDFNEYQIPFFTGHIDQDTNLFQKHGQFVWADGSYYRGEFLDGDFSGSGMISLADGRVYKGEFIGGLADGPGTMMFPSNHPCGYTFQCVFERGQIKPNSGVSFHDGRDYVKNFPINLLFDGKVFLETYNFDLPIMNLENPTSHCISAYQNMDTTVEALRIYVRALDASIKQNDEDLEHSAVYLAGISKLPADCGSELDQEEDA